MTKHPPLKPYTVSHLLHLVESNYYLNLICKGCGRSVLNEPANIQALIARYGDMPFQETARRFRCKECGHKGASISMGYWMPDR